MNMSYFEKVTPEKVGISSLKVLEFLERCKKKGLQLHSVMFVRDSKIFAESWWRPYNKDSKHSMFSFTKSLTSTAIGFCVQEGLLSLDEKLVDIFPEHLPEEVSENLAKVTVLDVLIMGGGHHSEPRAHGENWIKEWLSHPFEHEPGTYFVYNSSGTNMLCAIIKKKTGLNMTEYLYPRLFEKIGMGEVPCRKTADGIDAGGGGSKLTTEQMALFIEFVMHKGNWKGQQLLSSEWFDAALSKQIDTKHSNSIPDWYLGYGYQFWMCQPEGVVRADGAFGQFGIMYPEKNAFFIIQGSSTNNFEVLQAVWDTFIGEFKDEELPENIEANTVLNYVLKNNEITPLESKRVYNSIKKYTKLRYKPEAPVYGGAEGIISGFGLEVMIHGEESDETIRNIYLEFIGNELLIDVNGEKHKERISVSLESHFNSFILNGKVYGAVGTWVTPDEFKFLIYCAETPNGNEITLNFRENKLYIISKSTYPESGWNRREIKEMEFVRIK
ncbi:MAG: beta-lactamase family protein [Ruminococcaceae bacterium]|nr:beta-lactamase family protein [Oscillospiraceae bacterium]